MHLFLSSFQSGKEQLAATTDMEMENSNRSPARFFPIMIVLISVVLLLIIISMIIILVLRSQLCRLEAAYSGPSRYSLTSFHTPK